MSKVLVSAQIVCYINGSPFGRVRAFRFSSETPRKPIGGIDISEPIELAMTTTRVRGSIELWRTAGDAGAEGAGITAEYADLPREKYFSIMLLDRNTDTVVFQSDFNVVMSQHWDFPSKGVVTGSIEFEGIDWSNELRPTHAT